MPRSTTLSESVMQDGDAAEQRDEAEQCAVQLRRRAMDLLARREHSRHELGEKLGSRFPDVEPVLLNETLDQLEADNLLSDTRFAESYVRMRRDRGYGPLYIQSQFGKRGVDPLAADAALDSSDDHWVTIAEEVARRKAGGKPVADQRDKARLLRFLASRGFTGEQSHKALRRLGQGDGYDD